MAASVRALAWLLLPIKKPETELDTNTSLSILRLMPMLVKEEEENEKGHYSSIKI